MRDVTFWSVSCGRGTDVDVRLHASLFVALAALLHLAARIGGGDATIVAVTALVVYAASLLAHELAHAWTAWKWGGRVECVLLGPHGGLLSHGTTLDARGDFAVAAAGPLANLAITIVAVLTLAAAGRPVVHIFFPFAPPSIALEANLVGAIALTAWINWLFVVLNVLPMPPFDGSRMLHAFIHERADAITATVQTSRVGMITAVGCFAAFWFVPGEYDAAAFGLLLLCVVGGFSSHWELQRAGDPEYDESLRYDEPGSGIDLDEPRPRRERLNPVRAWWRRRQEAKVREQMLTEREEEQRADEVLARLHDGGIQSLSAHDRALLERVSARYRRRH